MVRDATSGSIYVLRENARYHITSCDQCGGRWCEEGSWVVNNACVGITYPDAGVHVCAQAFYYVGCVHDRQRSMDFAWHRSTNGTSYSECLQLAVQHNATAFALKDPFAFWGTG